MTDIVVGLPGYTTTYIYTGIVISSGMDSGICDLARGKSKRRSKEQCSTYYVVSRSFIIALLKRLSLLDKAEEKGTKMYSIVSSFLVHASRYTKFFAAQISDNKLEIVPDQWMPPDGLPPT